ncbi:MAG TPA: hypothetical protein VGD60_03080 [Candidatus Acidoferrales bacterium]
MTRHTKFGFAASAVLLAVLAAAPLHAQDVTTLQNDLNAKYKSSVILVIQKNGITGQAPNNLAPPCGSTWKDNALHPGNAMCLLVQKNYSKALTKDEKVNPTGVVIHLKDEKVIVNFTECDSCNGGDASSYKGSVAFQFPKGYIEGGADAGQIADVISQVLAPPDPNADQGNQQQQGGDQGQQQQQAAPQQQAPQQPAAPPASIQLGQTVDQVTASFGPPEKIVNLGTKQIYVYKDLKVTFVNGKVTDVQ